MDIISIFYSEFDIVSGPELRYQYPLNAINLESFKKISWFVIPNNNLCGKLNTLKLSDPDLIIKLNEVEKDRDVEEENHRGLSTERTKV